MRRRGVMAVVAGGAVAIVIVTVIVIVMVIVIVIIRVLFSVIVIVIVIIIVFVIVIGIVIVIVLVMIMVIVLVIVIVMVIVTVMSRVHVDRSCREFMLRVYVERLCSDFTRHVMFRLHSSYDVLRHWAGSDGMFFADALSESCIFNDTTTNVLSTFHHSAIPRPNVTFTYSDSP